MLRSRILRGWDSDLSGGVGLGFCVVGRAKGPWERRFLNWGRMGEGYGLGYRFLEWNLCLLGGPARVSSMLSQILSGGV